MIYRSRKKYQRNLKPMHQPIIRDKTHDPFIIFGGLFSRSVVQNELDELADANTNEELLQKIGAYCEEVKNYCPNENHLRKKISTMLLGNKSTVLPESSVTDIVYDNVVVEVKNQLTEWNLDALKGSKKVKGGARIETAEEELFRYIHKEGSEYSWGVLTNDRQFRFYHQDSDINCLEFDIFDIAKSAAKFPLNRPTRFPSKRTTPFRVALAR